MKGFKKDGKFRPTGRSKSEFSKKQMMSHEEHWKDAKEEIGEDTVLRIFQKQNDKYSEELKNRKKESFQPKPVDLNDKAVELIELQYDKIFQDTAVAKEGEMVGTDIHHKGKKTETICGASTEAVENLIWGVFGKDFGQPEYGFYTGDDRKHSELFNGFEDELKHEWFRLPDGTIIDGACGQFEEEQEELDKSHRLRIIRPDDPRQNDYVLNKSCPECGTHYKGSECPHCKEVKGLQKEADRRGITLKEMFRINMEQKYG